MSKSNKQKQLSSKIVDSYKELSNISKSNFNDSHSLPKISPAPKEGGQHYGSGGNLQLSKYLRYDKKGQPLDDNEWDRIVHERNKDRSEKFWQEHYDRSDGNTRWLSQIAVADSKAGAKIHHDMSREAIAKNKTKFEAKAKKDAYRYDFMNKLLKGFSRSKYSTKRNKKKGFKKYIKKLR